MKIVLNIIWFILGGAILGLLWFGIGIIWCITIIGIPIGIQCFKFSSLLFFPFGKRIEYDNSSTSLLLNILWLVFGGLKTSILSFLLGILFCITIIGIPFGLQWFKMAKLSLMPFGSSIILET
ncbi:MAG: YccF domain-containing protein [Chitinophagaceae bacterium]|nr:YccF domain-containing protein [Chitinophagaceae bacterium]